MLSSPCLPSPSDLVIARKGIQKTEECAAGGGVHDLVNPWEGIGVLGAGLVEVGEIDAEAASSGVLGDDNTVGEPSGVDNFLDDACFLQLFYFLDDEILFLWRLTSRLLLHGTCVWTHG